MGTVYVFLCPAGLRISEHSLYAVIKQNSMLHISRTKTTELNPRRGSFGSKEGKKPPAFRPHLALLLRLIALKNKNICFNAA